MSTNISNIKITSVPFIPAAWVVLEKYAHRTILAHTVLHVLSYELPAVGQRYNEDDWDDILDHISINGLAGFQEIRKLVEGRNPSVGLYFLAFFCLLWRYLTSRRQVSHIATHRSNFS